MALAVIVDSVAAILGSMAAILGSMAAMLCRVNLYIGWFFFRFSSSWCTGLRSKARLFLGSFCETPERDKRN